MTFEQALEAMRSFEGRPVEVDSIATRFASPPYGGTPTAGSAGLIAGEPMTGVVRRMHPSEVDEFWWTLPPDGWYALEPGHRMLVQEHTFRNGMWEGDSLVLGFSACIRRIVPLVRSDALQTLANLFGRAREPDSDRV